VQLCIKIFLDEKNKHDYVTYSDFNASLQMSPQGPLCIKIKNKKALWDIMIDIIY